MPPSESAWVTTLQACATAAAAGEPSTTSNAITEPGPAVGVAPSTCLRRVRALRESAAIRESHADIDLTRVGLPIQAIIAVRMQARHREQIQKFVTRCASSARCGRGVSRRRRHGLPLVRRGQ